MKVENRRKSQKQLIKKIGFIKKISLKHFQKAGFKCRELDEKLKFCQDQSHKVLATIHEGVTFSDEEGHFYVYNLGMEKLTGYSMEEANACPDFIRLLYPDPKNQQIALKGIGDLLEKRIIHETEVVITTKIGQLKNVLVSSSLICHEGHRLFLSIYNDITERKLAENRLLALNNVFLGFGVNTDQNIASLTAVLGEILGATYILHCCFDNGLLRVRGSWNMPIDFNFTDRPDNCVSYDVIRSGENITVIQNLAKTIYAQTDPNVNRYQLKTYIGCIIKNNEKNIGALCCVFQRDFIPSKDDIEVIGIIASAIEVEEKRKQAEELLRRAYADLKETRMQLIQADKLEAIGRMASGVAHEVLNPLAIIMQGINYLEGEVHPEQEDIFTAVRMMKENIKRADSIVRTLLEFSRPGELALKAENINSILESSLDLVRHKFKSDIAVSEELIPDLPMVLADKNKMEQVFINLFLNSIQAMPSGGKLFLRSYLVCLNEAKNGVGRRQGDRFKLMEKAVVVQVEDTGSGISKENLSKIFDPFFTTKGPKEGVGLGLLITKNIIDLHKGLIEIESQVGKGTKFSIFLKVA